MSDIEITVSAETISEVIKSVNDSAEETNKFMKEQLDKLNAEYIYLRPQTDESGRVRLVDQHGRILSGVRMLNIETDMSEPTVININMLAKNADGKPIKNRF